MKLGEKIRRLFLFVLPSGSRDKVSERQLAILWQEVKNSKPQWYNPLNDQLSLDFGHAIGILRDSITKIAKIMNLKLGAKPLPSFRPELNKLFFDRYLKKAGLSREELTFKTVYEEAKKTNALDYLSMEHSIRNKIKVLSKKELQSIDDSMIYIEAIIQLASYDWAKFEPVYPRAGITKIKKSGTEMLDAIEDLVFIVEPVIVTDTVKEIFLAFGEAYKPEMLEDLADACKVFVQDQRLKNMVRAIRSLVDMEFKPIKLSTSPVSQEFKNLMAEFSTDLKSHIAETERIKLAIQLKKVFGEGELQQFNIYNEQTNQMLIERNLPQLTYAGTIQVLYNFKVCFHQPLYQEFFQQFQLQAEFVSEYARKEFTDHLDLYFSMVVEINKFSDDLSSKTFSPLKDVLSIIEQPYIDPTKRNLLKQQIEDTNSWADKICQTSFQTIKKMNVLFQKYLVDIDSPDPRIFTGGKVIREKFPILITGLTSGAFVLTGMISILRAMIIDLNSAQDRLNKMTSTKE